MIEIDADNPTLNAHLDPHTEPDIAVDFSDTDDEANIVPTHCAMLTGPAGCGKTYMVRERIATDPTEGVLCATTGIAAVNLGTITINSLLKYYDTDSLTNAFISGRLTTTLARLAKSYRNLYLDEVSMMAAEQLDVLYQAVGEANKQKSVQKVRPEGLGLVMVGDFMQLPPINARWAFEADCWSEFEPNITRLVKNWRQGEGEFLNAINLLRSGDGAAGANALTFTDTTFTNALDLSFPGTTIMAKNDEVDRFNWVALRKVNGEAFRVQSRRWYEAQQDARWPPNDWKNIPESLELKVGAYVMILANARMEGSADFAYANGDCGWIVARNKDSISVKLARNEKVVDVVAIERHATTTDYDEKRAGSVAGWGRPWFDEKSQRYVIGTVRYVPLRLAWASTVHKCVSPDERIPIIGKGLIPIGSIDSEDQTPYGPILATAKTFQRAYRLVTHRGYEVICSTNHIWSLEDGLKETGQIEIGDRIQLASFTSFNGNNLIDKEFAWWLGALVGDGCYTDKKEGQLHFANIDFEVGERYRLFIKSRGLRAQWRSDMRGVHSTSKPFRGTLEQLGVDYVKAPEKTIPHAVWESGPACWPMFLQGLFDSDGCVGRSTIILTTRSEELGREVQLMLLFLGIPTKRRCWKTGYKGSGDLYWQVSLSSGSLRRFESMIGFSHPDKKSKLSTIFPNRNIVRFDGFDTVERIEDLGVDIEMIDVEIPAPHLLSFSGIMGHNSQGLTLDRVQLDLRNAFFGKPAMAYVAVSRCRTASGLRIIGTERLLAQRCVIDPKVKRWI